MRPSIPIGKAISYVEQRPKEPITISMADREWRDEHQPDKFFKQTPLTIALTRGDQGI